MYDVLFKVNTYVADDFAAEELLRGAANIHIFFYICRALCSLVPVNVMGGLVLTCKHLEKNKAV